MTGSARKEQKQPETEETFPPVYLGPTPSPGVTAVCKKHATRCHNNQQCLTWEPSIVENGGSWLKSHLPPEELKNRCTCHCSFLPACQVLNPQRQTNFSSSSSQAKDAFKVSVTLSEMVSKARESLITVVQSYTTSRCPELTPPAKDLHAFISQVTNQVIKSCAWQNTGKERARYQKSPRATARAYLHREAGCRKAMLVLVCGRRVMT